MVGKVLQLFAKPIYKLIARGAGQTGRKSKVISHYEYGGKKYLPDDMKRVIRRGEKGRPVRGLVPNTEEAERISKLGTKEKVFSSIKRRETSPAVMKQIKKLDEMTEDEVKYITKEKAEKLGITEYTLAPYRQTRLGGGQHGTRTKFTDAEGKPIYLADESNAKAINKLSDKNSRIVYDRFKEIDIAGDKSFHARTALMQHLGRMVKQSKGRGISEDKIIEKFSQLDAPWWGNFLAKRGRLNNREIKKAKELGVISDDELLEISHIVRAADDPMKSFDKENVFWSMYKQNRDRMRAQEPIPGFEEGYENMLHDRIKGYYGFDQGGIVNGYAGGGLIKAGLKKLLGDSLGMMSRRKFMKGVGATAASAALPRSAMKLAAPAAKKVALSFAPPWVNGMLSALKSAPLHTAAVDFAKLGNNAHIAKIGSKKIKIWGHEGKAGTESHFRVKSSDMVEGDKIAGKADDFWDDVVLTEEPGQTSITWKNKMYDHGNDQHIVIDKVNKETRFVDDNWHMEAGGEDIAKDDWIEYAMTTDKKALAKEMGLAKGDEIGEKLVDEWSVSGMDNDYADMFRSYVDSFSPSGNVFGTVGKMKDMLTKPSITKKYKKEIGKMQKSLDTHQENKMLDWEGQFRGGQGMHGYYRGGTSMRDYPQARKMDINKLVDAVGMAETAPAYMKSRNLGPRNEYISPTGNYGTYGLSRENFTRGLHMERADKSTYEHDRLAATGYGVPRWKNWENTWKDEALQKQASKRYLQGMVDYYSKNRDKMKYGSDPYYEALLRYGPEDTRETGDYFNKVMGFYNRGGLAKKFSVADAVATIKASPQKFQGGGLVKLFAPKVMGKLSKYAPKITGITGKGPDLSTIRADLYTPPKGPYTITSESGARILDRDFKTLEEAQGALKEMVKGFRTQDASTFKIFGKRPPKTKAGVSEGAPEVDLGMVGKELPPEKPGAMFWGSREKIIHAPSEAMTGKQWLQYLQLPKHGILNPKGFPIVKHMELNDTGLAPHLSKIGNNTMSKAQLVDDFDTKLAPELDVTVLGSKISEGGKFYGKMSKMDLQPYREGPVKNVLKTVKDQGFPLKEALANNNTDEIMRIIKVIEDSTFNNFGVANSIMEGFPKKFPFELKKVLQEIAQLSGARTAGFKKYAKEVQYSGQQTLGGGQNYREFLFKYKHPAGSLRETEPMTRYSKLGADHFSSLSDKDQMGGFVHMRTSDRTDEFGRRILHIEEIQSDMHQKINSAMRSVRRMEKEGKPPVPGTLKQSKYAPRGDMIVETVDKANEQHLALLASKIEDLAAMPQTKATQIRLVRLNKERAKVRKMIQDKKAKMATGDHSGVAQGPYSKTEDYNEFVMKYAEKVAQEGGYDGVTISSSAIKNRSLSPGNTDYGGNVVAYGPMAEGAMKKVAKKSGAKYLKTSIIDDKGRGWEVPMIWLDDKAKFNVARGLPAYKRGGIAVNG